MKTNNNFPPDEVSVTVDGRTFHGTYRVSGGVVTVSSAYGGDSTQLGRSPAETLAKIMLAGLVRKAIARGEVL